MKQAFDEEARQFCADTGGLFCEIREEESGNRLARISYPYMVVEFRYTAHGMLLLVNSILEAVIYLDKTEGALGIPLAFCVDYCDIDTLTPLTIPCISNEAGMQQAFLCIAREVKGLLPPLREISLHPDEKNKLIAAFKEELAYLYNESIAHDMEGYDTFYTGRYTSAPFMNLLNHRYEKAAKQLGKMKKPTNYERRIWRLLQVQNPCEQENLSEIRKNTAIYNESGVQKNDMKEFTAMFFSWFVLAIGITPLYLAVYFTLMWIEGRDSVYLMGPMTDFPSAIFAAFLVAVAASYFTRHRFYRLLHKKSYAAFREKDSMESGPGVDKFMRGFLKLCIVGTLVWLLFVIKCNLNFKEDGFIDNTKFFSLRGQYYNYEQVEKVYYRPDRVNGFGETLEFPSYVLVLENGKEIDFYEHGEIEDYEDELLEHLRGKGVAIEGQQGKKGEQL